MALLLWRSNPRRTGGVSLVSLVARGTQSDVLAEGLYFALVARGVTAGQGSQTSDLSASATTASDAVITSGNGSQTADIVGVLISVGDIDAGQGGQTADGLFLPTLNADIEVGGGEQTADLAGDVSPFQAIGARGWWDSADLTAQPGAALWQMNPRFQGGGISRVHALGGVRPIVVGGGPGFPPIYGDGSAHFEIANGLQFNPVPWFAEADAFGLHLIRDVNAQVVGLSAINDGAFGLANIFNQNIDSTVDAGQGSQTSIVFIVNEGALTAGQGSQTSSIAASNGVGGTQTVTLAGFTEGRVGSHTISQATRTLAPTGIAIPVSQVGANGAIAAVGPRYIFADAIDEPAIFEPIIGNDGYQVIEMVTLGDAIEFGDVTFTETASPPSGSNRYIKLGGIVSPGFGATRLNPVQIRLNGFAAGGVGRPTISNWIRYVSPPGITGIRFGTDWISNWIRYVELDGFDTSIVWDDFGPIDTAGQRGQIYNVYGSVTGIIGNAGIGVGATGTPSLRINLC